MEFSPNKYERVKYIVVNSEPLRSRLEYNRSRLRICRSWIINFSFIFIVSFVWMSVKLINLVIHKELIAITTISFLFGIATYFIWKGLVNDYWGEVRDSYDFLTKFANTSTNFPI